jgi:pimeloyl-ACP methyl ester carboxylesterase
MMESLVVAAPWANHRPRNEGEFFIRMLRESAGFARLMTGQFRLPPLARERIDSAPVMVLPGLMMSDFHTQLLRRTLRSRGVNAIGWGHRTNRGIERTDLGRLESRMLDLADRSGRKVALIGWSLGGFFACDLAERNPDKVSMVVTLGTPFSHRRARPRGHQVFTVACWSSRDEVVSPASAAGRDGEVHKRVRLNCTHCEMVSDPEAIAAVITLLREHPASELGAVAGAPELAVGA